MTDINLLMDQFSSKAYLLCKLCDKYLTISPLYFVDGIGSVCGRCTSKAREMCKDNNKFNKQTVLEDLLTDLNVPCSNKRYGCEVVLTWNDNVLEHERKCQYKKEICPLNYHDCFDNVVEKCLWSGHPKDFADHVKEDHKCLIKEYPFHMELEERGQNFICFNRIQQQLVTIVLKFVKPNFYYFMIMIHGTDGDSQCYSLDLKIFDDKERHILSFHKDKLESLKYLNYYLDSNNSGFNEKMFKIDITAIRDLIKFEENLSLKFQLWRKSMDEINAIQTTNVLIIASNHIDVPGINNTSLKCLKCNSYSTGKIFTLIPCANRNTGCLFVSNNSKACEDHELICEFRPVKYGTVGCFYP